MATGWQIGDMMPEPNTGKERYEIRKILRGGMGVIYVVFDHEWREVFAAKSFQDRFLQSKGVADRFAQEALVWTRLDSHAHIVRAHMVRLIRGRPYLFLEFVPGGDLSGWIGTARLDLRRTLLFALQFCWGMAYALSKRDDEGKPVIKAHRDIKPANCLITEDGNLKVTDFGLAKAFDDVKDGELAAEVEPRHDALRVVASRSGMAAGTPPYMAPEQFEDAKGVDVRADVYSFGVMLYEMVTGRVPFAGPTFEDFRRQHQEAEPAPFGKRLEAVFGVVARCLRKRPEERYADFGQIIPKLRLIYEAETGEKIVDYMQDEAFLNLRRTAMEAMERFDRTGELPEPGNPLRDLILTFHSLGQSIAEQVGDLSIEEFNKRRERADAALAQVFEESFGEKTPVVPVPILKADDLVTKAFSLLELKQPREALSCCMRALAIDPNLVRAWNNAAVALAEMGRYGEAMRCYDRALAVDPSYAKAWMGKGTYYGRAGRYQEELECYDRALRSEPHLVPAVISKATALDDLGRYVESLRLYNDALELEPHNAMAWFNRGNTLGHLGRHGEAVDSYRRALGLDPEMVPALGNMAQSLLALGRPAEALACYERGLSISPTDTRLCLGKSLLLYLSGRVQEALHYALEADRLGDPNARMAVEACLERGAVLPDQFGEGG